MVQVFPITAYGLLDLPFKGSCEVAGILLQHLGPVSTIRPPAHPPSYTKRPYA